MAQYTWIALLKRTTVIPLTFDAKTFLMKIQPLGPREGSRGIFVFRKQYEPLLTYGSRFAHAGDVVLDLGANQGIFCCASWRASLPSSRIARPSRPPFVVARVT
jgi:hypothetical protein